MASVSVSITSESFVSFSDPSLEDKNVALRDVGETEELKEECLKKLRTLIKDQKLICITSDEFLLRFLRTKKFHVQQSFEMLQSYTEVRAALHNNILKLQPELVKSFLHRNIAGILPCRDSEGRMVLFINSGIWNTEICTQEELFTIGFMIANYISEDQSSQIGGIVSIHDHKLLGLKDVTFALSNARLVKRVVMDSLPIKYAKTHIVNEHPLTRYIHRILKPMIPKQMRKTILIHGKSREVLFQHISPAILPSEMGGSYGALSNDDMADTMEDYLKKMKEEQCYFIGQNC